MELKEFADKYFDGAKTVHLKMHRLSGDDSVVVNIEAQDKDGDWLKLIIPGSEEDVWEDMLTLSTEKELVVLP